MTMRSQVLRWLCSWSMFSTFAGLALTMWQLQRFTAVYLSLVAAGITAVGVWLRSPLVNFDPQRLTRAQRRDGKYVRKLRRTQAAMKWGGTVVIVLLTTVVLSFMRREEIQFILAMPVGLL